ncbi:HLA class II histocompatibility antigen, DQ beta 1 chain [Myotis davidii]|uniref:HLA class II histocompatibility antigen, DQ beta 1 chain n=1 Tax=Myotis davidii TaxID=225400 RepID=L5MK76_MYODS|nr:HLA class II histocompatibility antigen, DQ beta 1 chain [Myotis davidii]
MVQRPVHLNPTCNHTKPHDPSQCQAQAGSRLLGVLETLSPLSPPFSRADPKAIAERGRAAGLSPAKGSRHAGQACQGQRPEGRLPAGDFLFQFKGLCYYTNGTQHVRLVTSYIYNREEFARFDSYVGEFRAVTPQGRLDAEAWNSQKDFLEETRAYVDTVCRHNYPLDEAKALHQRAHIKVRWFRNDQEETAGVVSTPLIRNGDWTYQILVMLEMTPQRGDIYTCRVEHPSLQSPIAVEWRKGQFVSCTLGPTDRGQTAAPVCSIAALPLMSLLNGHHRTLEPSGAMAGASEDS